jgi:putative tryptophan/tyrosine transport system substrate-binding protein
MKTTSSRLAAAIYAKSSEELQTARADRMKRREFITLLGGAAAAWPLGARAQQGKRMRRIGVLLPSVANDPEYQARVGAFMQALALLGWTDGRNVRIETRWAASDADRYRQYAAELVALAPDVIVAVTSPVVAALQRETRSVPIVFVQVIDPVGTGLVTGLARPEGNTTGFTVFEYGLSPKWLALLKEIAPRVTRAAVFRDPTVAAQIGLLGGIQSVAPSLRMELSLIDNRDAGEMERAVAAFAREPNGGQIALGGFIFLHRELMITLAARHRLPTVSAGKPLDMALDQFSITQAVGAIRLQVPAQRRTQAPRSAPSNLQIGPDMTGRPGEPRCWNA